MNLNRFLTSHPIFDQSTLIQSICKPIFDAGITFFSHGHVENQEMLSCLSTCPDFSEKYFQKEYFHFDLHKKPFKNREQYILWDLMEQVNETKAMEDDFMSYNYGHTFSLVFSRGSSTDYYHFAAALGDSAKNKFYLENINFLKKFIMYFHQEVSSHKVLAQAYQRKLTLAKDHGGFFIVDQEEPPLVELPLKRIPVNGSETFLSLREFECLHWFSRGKTIEEVSMILEISPRTVKAHISNIKSKLGCVSLFQLGMIYQENRGS